MSRKTEGKLEQSKTARNKENKEVTKTGLYLNDKATPKLRISQKASLKHEVGLIPLTLVYRKSPPKVKRKPKRTPLEDPPQDKATGNFSERE